MSQADLAPTAAGIQPVSPQDAGAPSDAPPTVADVVGMLRAAAPPELAEPWDSNQLICGDPADSAGSVLLAVDPVTAVVDEAIERGVDMVITHHPLYLRGTDHVSATDPKGRTVHRLIRHGIALANAHTTLDAAHGGVAAALAAAVGVLAAVPLEPDPHDPTQGIGRIGDLQCPTRLRDLAVAVASALPDSAPGLLVGGDLDATVETVAVSGGAGDSLLDTARDAGADVLLTADLRHRAIIPPPSTWRPAARTCCAEPTGPRSGWDCRRSRPAWSGRPRRADVDSPRTCPRSSPTRGLCV